MYFCQKCPLVCYDIIRIVTLESLKQDITSTIISPQAKCCGWDGKDDWKDYLPCSCSVKGNATVNATNEINDQKNVTCFSSGTLLNNTRGIYTQVRFQFCSLIIFGSIVFQHHTLLSLSKGCSENIKEWLNANLNIILVVILAICVVEVSKLSPNTLHPIQKIQMTINLYLS